MVRTIVVNPVLVAVTVAAALLCCRAGGLNPHGRDAAAAAAVAVAASIVAGTVLGLGRLQSPTPAGPAMSSLLAMSAFLGTTLLLSIVAVMAVGVDGVPFACWMLGLFWVTLLGLAAVCVWTVRAAAPRPALPGAAG